MTYNIHKNGLLTLVCIVALACMTATTAFAKGSKGCKGSKGSKGSKCTNTVLIEEVRQGCLQLADSPEIEVLNILGKGFGDASIVKLGRELQEIDPENPYTLGMNPAPRAGYVLKSETVSDNYIIAQIPDDLTAMRQYLLLVGSGDLCATDKPTSLTFEYTGGGCSSSTYTPGTNKFKCEGTSGGYTGPLVFTVPEEPGDKLGSSISLNIGGQRLEIHTSCSADLKLGDQFGAVTLVGYTGGDDSLSDEFDMTYFANDCGVN